MVNFLQVNPNGNWAAEQLLAQTAVDTGAGVLIISEPATHCDDPNQWAFSTDRKAAVSLRDSNRPCLIEIRGIGQDEEEEDVVLGVCRYGASPEEVIVKKMEPSFGGRQRGFVSVSATKAERVIAEGRVLVGLISCRVRLKGNPPIRCFRCHGYNHKAPSCKGPEWSKLCVTYGREGHLAKQCRSAPNFFLCKELKMQPDHYPGSGR